MLILFCSGFFFFITYQVVSDILCNGRHTTCTSAQVLLYFVGLNVNFGGKIKQTKSMELSAG